MKIYLAGPMRGIPFFNFPTFNAVAARLRADGHTVFNPAEEDIKRTGFDPSQGNTLGTVTPDAADKGITIRQCLAHDLAWICAEAEAIVLLPGWEKSTGATAERATCVAIGAKVLEYGKDI